MGVDKWVFVGTLNNPFCAEVRGERFSIQAFPEWVRFVGDITI